MVTENTAPNAAADVEMSQYVADRTRVNEDKIKQDDEIISQFGDYSYGWHDSDAAGEAAKRGIDENVVRAISADNLAAVGRAPAGCGARFAPGAAHAHLVMAGARADHSSLD